MWNNFGQYLHQISRPSTPKSSPYSPSSWDQKILSPRVRFPHIYSSNNLDPSSLQYGYDVNHAVASRSWPVDAFPYPYPYPYPMDDPSWPVNYSNSPPEITQSPVPGGALQPHLSIGMRFGLVPATPHKAMEEEGGGQQGWPPAAELVGYGGLSVSGNHGAYKTRGISGRGLADEETQLRVERFKIRTVDIDDMVVQAED
ncbi:hypothetical protein SAY87_027383 [Trapa incisa]|uniref:Uncharacterized protein n=1 Tax=Trapa incisa TaxID=236973 RepID=A0AAN7JLR7_9MYRT|nr:hypothetical protein SAY87_027383 [Trapa incisa]